MRPVRSAVADWEKDDREGGRRAKIVFEPHDLTRLIITDPDASNGTYVNKHQIANSARIAQGDKVQIRLGGPELIFASEPSL